MARKCLRPGCTTQVDTIGVCVSCADSDYKPTDEGVQVRDTDGTYMVTNGGTPGPVKPMLRR